MKNECLLNLFGLGSCNRYSWNIWNTMILILASFSPMKKRVFHQFPSLKVQNGSIFWFGSCLTVLLSSAEVLRKNYLHNISCITVRSLCSADGEMLVHLFLECPYSLACCYSLFSIFKAQWVFSKNTKCNVVQLLIGFWLLLWLHFLWTRNIFLFMHERVQDIWRNHLMRVEKEKNDKPTK